MIKYLRIINLAIGVITIVSGAVQVVAPSFVLNIIHGEITDTSTHFFAIIGMFMFLFGGLIVNALYSVQSNRAVFLWGGLQKLGASAAVFIGIYHHLFSGMAAAVASFDFVSCLLLFWYYKKTDLLNS